MQNLFTIQLNTVLWKGTAEQGAGRWVKASDILDPGITKYYIVRWNTGADRIYINSNLTLKSWCNNHGLEMNEVEILIEPQQIIR